MLLTVASVLVACETSVPGEQTHTSDATPRAEAHCRGETYGLDVSASPRRALVADIDGDGGDDSVTVVEHQAGRPGCRFFLVVEDGDVYATPIDPSGDPRSLQVPTLNSLAELDGDPGSEIIVNIEMGASTQFVGAFTMATGGLQRMTLRGQGPGPFAAELGHADLFPYGGSVGHLEAVDCIDDRLVVMSAAIPKGSSAEAYEVERRFFRVVGTELLLDKDLTEHETVRGLQVDDFPEFGGSPFLSCE